MLAAVILTLNNNAGWLVSNSNGGVRLIDVLPPGPGRPECVDTAVAFIDFDFNRVVNLGLNPDAGKACVTPGA